MLTQLKIRSLWALVIIATTAMASFTTVAQTLEWPQEISGPGGTIVVYQPQPERLEGNTLTGRAAMSLELEGEPDLIFGVFFFDARISTDLDAGTALLTDIKVTSVKWPDSKDAGEQRFTAAVEGSVPSAGFEISLERLSASLEAAEVQAQSLEELNNDPPKILFSESLSVLLLYDGAPRYSEVENSDYERVLNTPFVVVRNTRTKDLYLSSGTLWYQARDPYGPWSTIAAPPEDLARMMPEPEADIPTPDTPPAIITADTPTELIVTDGRPEWLPLASGELLYVSNTESPWLRELATNNMYVLLAGRWYRSKSTDGPWTFVRPDELPASFEQIPPASDIGGLRTSVAGTPEAEAAMLDAQIPQTAAIQRDEATLTVEYDGSPRFEEIPGTEVAYAINTASQVLLINDRYYAVDNAVWFTSASARGPWVVADDIPQAAISQIPASSPVYNVTHVHVYQSTPEVVYVGYTPGYRWSFPYYGVPVYGTGWIYPPYYGRYYYPRPPTWGLHVGYNPWTGWSYGVSWSYGFLSVGVRWGGGYHGGYYPGRCCGGWYGGGYRRPVVINTGNINIGNSINVGNRVNAQNRIARSTPANLDRSRRNLYNQPANRSRLQPATANRNLREARPATTRPNNVFADRNGNVARRTDSGWQTRQNGQWTAPSQPVTRPAPTTRPTSTNRPAPATRPTTRPTTSNRSSFDQGGFDRAHSARQTGVSRERSRPTNMDRSRNRGR